MPWKLGKWKMHSFRWQVLFDARVVLEKTPSWVRITWHTSFAARDREVSQLNFWNKALNTQTVRVANIFLANSAKGYIVGIKHASAWMKRGQNEDRSFFPGFSPFGCTDCPNIVFCSNLTQWVAQTTRTLLSGMLNTDDLGFMCVCNHIKCIYIYIYIHAAIKGQAHSASGGTRGH